MQIITIAAGALLAALPLVQADGSAIIHNKCDFDVYLWSIDTDNAPSEPTKLSSGGQYKENYKTPVSGGVSLKLSNDTSNGGAITQFEYTLDGFIWYDLSNVNCKETNCPFQKYGMYMESGSGCPTVSCAAGDLICKGAYNDPDDNENSLSCDSSADTQVYLCVDSASGSPGSSSSPTSGGPTSSSAAPSASSTRASSSAAATSVATPDYNQPSSAASTSSTTSASRAASPSSAVASAAEVAAVSPTTLLTTAAPAAVTVYTTVTAATTTTQWVKHAARHAHHAHHARNFHH